MIPERSGYGKEYLECYWNSCGIPKKFMEEEFDVKKIPGGVTVRDQVLGINLCDHGMLLHGTTGRGKTRLAIHAMHSANQAGFSCRFMDFQAFASEAVSAYRGGTEKAFFRDLKRPQILLLDDIGKAKITPKVAEAVFGIVDARMNMGKTLVGTTNETGKSLDARFEDKECVSALLRRIREICKMVAI